MYSPYAMMDHQAQGYGRYPAPACMPYVQMPTMHIGTPHMNHPHGAVPFSTPVNRQRTPNGSTPSRTVPMTWTHQGQVPMAPPSTVQMSGGHKHPLFPVALGSSENKVNMTPGGLSTPKGPHQSLPLSAATAATTTALAEKLNPISGKGLERDLINASKDELVQVLLDLSSCNSAAASFILSKAQLFALRQPATATGVEIVERDGSFQSNNDTVMSTPSKPLFVDDASCLETPNRSMHHRVVGGTPSPAREHLQERRCTPETRAFATDLHPCLKLYGACRHTTNCIFKMLPRNLCLHWIRGSCASGTDCGCVHRMPPNCPTQVIMVYDLAHGGDRTAMGKKAALMLSPAATSHSANDSVLTGGDVSPIVEDGFSTPRDDAQKTLRRDPIFGSQQDSDEMVEGPSPVARCLNDSLEAVA